MPRRIHPIVAIVLPVASLAAPFVSGKEAAVPLLSFSEQAVHTLKIAGSADFLVLEGDEAWVTNEGRVEKLKAGDIATGAGRVWVRAKTTALSVIDPATNLITARYGPPCGSGAVRANDRVVWVTAHDIQTVWVLKP